MFRGETTLNRFLERVKVYIVGQCGKVVHPTAQSLIHSKQSVQMLTWYSQSWGTGKQRSTRLSRVLWDAPSLTLPPHHLPSRGENKGLQKGSSGKLTPQGSEDWADHSKTQSNPTKLGKGIANKRLQGSEEFCLESEKYHLDCSVTAVASTSTVLSIGNCLWLWALAPSHTPKSSSKSSALRASPGYLRLESLSLPAHRTVIYQLFMLPNNWRCLRYCSSLVPAAHK